MIQAASTKLQGLQDIIPPPMLAPTTAGNPVLILCLLLAAIAIAFALYRYWQRPLKQCRREYHRLARNLATVPPAKAGEILGKILLKRFKLPHLNLYPGETTALLIKEEDWQALVDLIYRARFSGKENIDLQPAMHMMQQLLWSKY